MGLARNEETRRFALKGGRVLTMKQSSRRLKLGGWHTDDVKQRKSLGHPERRKKHEGGVSDVIDSRTKGEIRAHIPATPFKAEISPTCLKDKRGFISFRFARRQIRKNELRR